MKNNMRKFRIVRVYLRPTQAGVTLIELMVSLAIGLVIVLAATMAYVSVRGTATATEAVSRINEDGKLALDILAREIQMAGYYPAAATDPTTPNIRGAYVNVKGVGVVAYDQGIFGCSGAQFLPNTGLCDTTATTAPEKDRDSIVLNYFSLVSVLDIGLTNTSVSRDCLNQSLSSDSTAGNDVRFAATPKQPMFVSNRFAINATSYSQASAGSTGSVKTISTGSLSCNGNGVAAESNTYQPIFEGVTQMVIRYAVNDGASETPQRFYTATQVGALAAAADGRTGWQRVSAVRVCLLMQSLTGGRNERANESTTGNEKKYTDCQGVVVTQATSDRNVYKTFTRVVATRNYLTGVQ